jgi:RNA polymerase sigma factor (TIGR02999 family)
VATPQSANITQLLIAWSRGDEESLNRLIPLVQAELRRIAESYLRQERDGHTLQASDLVQEAYLRLVDRSKVKWQNRAHFFGVAARLMREILVDYARRRERHKRGGGVTHLTLDQAVEWAEARDVNLVALDDALNSFEKFAPRQCRVIELLFFGGLTAEEIAAVLGVATITVRRDWRAARAWLHDELSRR